MNNTTKRLLLVDDDDIFRETLGKALTRAGYDTITASDGAQALKRLKSEKMDILVIDIFMPEKDGIEVLREIRNLPQMPAIVTISGANINADFYTRVTRFLGAGGTLLKPFTLDQMLGVLSNLRKETVLNNAEHV